MVLVAPVLWVQTIKEFKTKPLQNSVRDLRKYGLQPDVVFCRCDKELPENIIKKISDITSVPRGSVFDAPDVLSIYQVPIAFYDRHVDDLFVDLLNLQRTDAEFKNTKK
jgi:CTP synthase